MIIRSEAEFPETPSEIICQRKSDGRWLIVSKAGIWGIAFLLTHNPSGRSVFKTEDFRESIGPSSL